MAAIPEARRGALLLVCVLALTGCAGFVRTGGETAGVSGLESTLYLDAVRALIAQGQYYAAIAHVQEDRRSHGDTAELRLLEADARRNLGQGKSAEALYQSVLRGAANGPLAAKAHHGLGLLYAPLDLGRSLRELAAASRLKPTDAPIRSDLGYAFLQMRRLAEARIELATANELAPDYLPARNNLLILLYAQGDTATAQRLAHASQIDPALLARLKAQAQSFTTPRRANSAGAP